MNNDNLYGTMGLFHQNISVLELPEHISNCLYANNIHTVWDLFDKTCSQLRKFEGIDETAILEMKEKLKKYNIELREKRHVEVENVKKYPYPINLFEAIKGKRDKIELPEEITPDIERGIMLALSHLDERAADMIMLRYKDNLSLVEIGEKYSFTGNRARQIISRAVRELAKKPMLQMIQLGHKGYVEFIVNRLAEVKTEVISLNAYNRGYEDGYADGYEQREKKEKEISALLEISVQDLDLSLRSTKGLKNAGIETIADLLKFNDVIEIKRIRNLGVKSLSEIARKLIELGCVNRAWYQLR